MLLTAIGCGDGRPGRVPVSGQVLIDGKPLTFGEVLFVPDEGRPSRGKIDSSGHFKLSCFGESDGAILGTHKVAISAVEPLSATKYRWHAPKKLADHQTSGLTQEITGPVEDLAINLSWEGGSEFVEIVPVDDEPRPAGMKNQ